MDGLSSFESAPLNRAEEEVLSTNLVQFQLATEAGKEPGEWIEKYSKSFREILEEHPEYLESLETEDTRMKISRSIALRTGESLPSDGEAREMLHVARTALAREAYPELDVTAAAQQWINTYGIRFDEQIEKPGNFWDKYRKLDYKDFILWIKSEITVH